MVIPVDPRRKIQGTRLKKPFASLLVSWLLFLGSPIKGQFYNLPNEYSFSLLTERKLAAKDSATHTGLKPYIHFFSDKYVHVADTHRIFKFIVDDPALDIAFIKHVITIKPRNQNFKLTLDPLLNFELGSDYYNDTVKTQTQTNTRGFIGCGYVGDKVYFETMFAESQSFFPQYLKKSSLATGIIPGQGRWKAFEGNGFDYAFSSGFVSYQPVKNLNLQFGHGKQKIGYGYRSLLLSDNSFNYPYVKFTQQWWKGRIQYSNIYALLMNLEPATAIPVPNTERLFQKKAASFQYLSVNPVKFLNIGLFQGMIWQAADKKNRQHLHWQYFNPVIFTNLPEYGLNNQNNILVGGDIRFKITNKLNVYGQLMADDLSGIKSTGNGFGYQAGINYFDALGLKNLFLQAEYNSVNEGSYTGPIGATTNQSYSHYSQYLAYTPGHGNEFIFMANYKIKRLHFNASYNYQDVPRDGDYYYNNQIIGLRTGFLLNPSYNLQLSLGYTHRVQNFPNFKNLSNETNFIYLGLRTNFYNIYSDF
ncbi:MAG: hypothetical protein K0S32_2653 [Bacteroidetes bacterium]|nr:hypothetical protein [Bacteroidota bacterium]